MSAEVKQTYAYWIRNEATDSQLEAIRSQHDELVRERARLRTEHDALRVVMAKCDSFLLEIRNHAEFGQAARDLRLEIEATRLLSADTAGQEREG